MADMNDFLKKLLAGKQSYENSPMDLSAPDEAPINQVVAEPADDTQQVPQEPVDADSMPAEDDTPASHQPVKLASDSDIAKIQAIPLPENQRSIASTPELPAAQPDQMPVPAATDASPQLSKYQQLMDAYKSKNNALDWVNIGGKLGQAIAAKGGAKIDDNTGLVNSLRQGVQDPLTQIKNESIAGSADPNSDISKFARERAIDVIQKMNPKANIDDYRNKFSKMSAMDLEKLGFKGISQMGITPYQQSMLDMYNARIANQKTALGQGEVRLGQSATKIENTKDTALSKEAQAFGGKIDAMDKTSRNNFGRAAASLNAATELETLTNAKPIDKLDSRDMAEVARIVNNMLTGGNIAAHSAIEELIPKTFQGKSAQWLEFISNSPQSVEAQDFVRNFQNLAQKQKTKSLTDIDAIVKSRIPEFYRLKNEKPEEFSNIVNAKINALNTISNAPKTSANSVPELKPYDGSTTSGIKSKAEAAAEKTGPSPDDVITIVGPSGQPAKMTRKNAEKYLSQPGYSIVGGQ